MSTFEKHSVRDLSWQSPDDEKRRELAAHLNSGYHRMDESRNASLTWLRKKHREAHAE